MHTQESGPTWVSYEEAGRLVGLGRTTLWRLVGAGEIEAAKVGRSVRLSRRSLEKFMERQADETKET